MPIWVLSDAGKTRTYDKVEIDNLVGNGLGITMSGTAKRAMVPVLTAGWTADTTGYKDATALGNITLYYTDLAHNLGSEVAIAVMALDTNGFHMETTQCQQYRDANTLRIWLARQPAYTTRWLVVG